jgi:hypothetical protein
MTDKTHWHGCWSEHHECAVKRIEALEAMLLDLVDACTPTVAYGVRLPERRIVDCARALLEEK